jgi:hypothetical protein
MFKNHRENIEYEIRRKMKNRILFLTAIVMVLFSINSMAFAQPSFSSSLSNGSLTPYKTSYIINDKLLIIEPADEEDVFFSSDAKISLLSLNEDTLDCTLLWSVEVPKVYDLHLLNNPDKIVVICAKDNYIQKLVFNLKGEIINEEQYEKINIDSESRLDVDDYYIDYLNYLGYQFKWVPPGNNIAEKIIMFKDGAYYFYKYPWQGYYKKQEADFAKYASEYRHKYDKMILLDKWFYQPENDLIIMNLAGSDVRYQEYIMILIKPGFQRQDFMNYSCLGVKNDTILAGNYSKICQFEWDNEQNKAVFSELPKPIKLDKWDTMYDSIYKNIFDNNIFISYSSPDNNIVKIYDLSGEFLNEFSFEHPSDFYLGDYIQVAAYKNDLLYYFDRSKSDNTSNLLKR